MAKPKKHHMHHKVGKKRTKKSKSHVRLEPTLKHMSKKGAHKRHGGKKK